MLSVLLSVLISPAAAAEIAAPPLAFEAGTVLAGGHVLAETLTLPPRTGPVILRTTDAQSLYWQVETANGETWLLQADGRWAAKAEYTRTERNGKPVCQIYQTYLSPEWAVRGGRVARDGAGLVLADDRIYAFRDVPCP